ncbi:CIS tube protein [Aliiglaciecola aliphaticivorans]
MSNLVKATLQKVLADEAETEDGDAFPVQFNPSSLKIRITNQVEGGRSAARQVRQQTGNSSRVLTMELVFDTADEGSQDSPVSVRQKTKQLEQFISTPENNPDPPPKLKFNWGDLTVVGIADSIDVSLEHFAANGYPLRAKVNLSIKEQDPTIVFKPADRGTGNAQSPGENSSLPGAGTNSGFSAGISVGAGIGLSAGIGVSAGFGVSAGISAGVGVSAGAKVGFALEGEMGAEFAARMGVDPAAWRSLEVDSNSGGSLAAGSQIAFNSNTNTSPGIGVSSGVNAEADVNQKASSGLNLASVEATNSPKNKGDADSAGKAISTLGGIEATINGVKLQNSQGQIEKSVSAFGISNDLLSKVNVVAGKAVDEAGINQSISRSPLVRKQDSDVAQSSNGVAQQSSLLDQRAMTYGQGIPLEPMFGVSQTQSVQKVYANRDLAIDRHAQGVPFTSNASTPSWIALPQRDALRQAIDSQSQSNSSSGFSRACQCTGASK